MSILGSFGENLPMFTVDLTYECCIPEVCFSAERRDLRRMKQEAVAEYEVESLSCSRLCKTLVEKECGTKRRDSACFELQSRQDT